VGVSWDEIENAVPGAPDLSVTAMTDATRNSFMDSALIYSPHVLGSQRAKLSLTSKANMFERSIYHGESFHDIRENPKYQWESNLRQRIIESFRRPPNESKAKEYLSKYNWPVGLQEALLKTCQRIPLRFFIIDDSGSMNVNDGRRLLTTNKSTKIINCTRWAELSQTLKFHAGLADAVGTVAEFRPLNGFQPLLVGLRVEGEEGEVLNTAHQRLDEVEPHGQTPLCEHITKVIVLLESVADILVANNQKACVVIATDGLATDGNLIEAMRPLTQVRQPSTCSLTVTNL
jgi:hypothetical protein